VSASIDVISGQASNAVLVPVEALHKLSDGSFTVFVMDNGKPVLRDVKVGLQDDTYAEIKSGLKAGEVVTTGVVETK
jgi:HlyD family secretion protein